MKPTTIHTYQSADAAETHADTGATGASTSKGYVSVDVFFKGPAAARTKHYAATDGLDAFDAVTLDAGMGGVTFYVDADGLDAATALRDALTAAIRTARRGTK